MSSSDEGSDSEDERTDVITDLSTAELEKIHQRGGGRRRFSVSAESSSAQQEARVQMAQAVQISAAEKTPEQIARIEKAVAGNILFEHVTNTDVLYARMLEEARGPGENEMVIVQGDEGDFFYVVESGKAVVIVNGKKVGTVTAGQSFGELALMYNAPRAATIKVVEETKLWKLDRLSFQTILMAEAEENGEPEPEGSVDAE